MEQTNLKYTCKDIIKYKENVNIRNLSVVLAEVSLEDAIKKHNELLSKNSNIAELAKKHEQEKGRRSSTQSLIDQLDKKNRALNEAMSQWSIAAKPLFEKATLVDSCVYFYNNGFKIAAATYDNKLGLNLNARDSLESGIGYLPKIYIQTKPKYGASELVKLAAQIFPYWQKVVSAHEDFWNEISKNGYTVSNQGATPSDAISALKSQYEHLDSGAKEAYSNLQTEQADAKKYGDTKTAVEKAKSELEEAKRTQADAKKALQLAIDYVSEHDPVCMNFAIGEGRIYDTNWLNTVQSAAEKRVSVQDLFYQLDVTSGNIIVSPKLNVDEKSDALKMAISSILMALPTGSVHISIVERDPVAKMLRALDQSVCEIIPAGENERQKQLYARISNKYTDMEGVNAELPSEVVVFTGYDEAIERTLDDWKFYVENGQSRGIWFIVVPGRDYKGEDKVLNCSMSVMPLPENKLHNPARYQIGEGSDQTGTLEDLIIEYLNNNCKRSVNSVYSGLSDLYNTLPIDNISRQANDPKNTFVIPFAQKLDDSIMSLKFNIKDHIFAFVLGQSGSGKSYLLHNLLSNMMLKYDPSILDIKLLDFKAGGPEFEYYKGAPHVTTLLTHGADKPIVREILSSLNKEMNRRGELFSSTNVKDIDEYNEVMTRNNKPLEKHIMLVVDECQLMFKAENGIDVSPEARNFFENIARQGRSAGMHMIFATQTLSSSDIPQNALAQFTDFLFMRCSSTDVENCGIRDNKLKNIVNSQTPGQVIHYHNNSYSQGFVFNYAGAEGELKEQTKQVLLNQKRYVHKPSYKQFYFNAWQYYYIDDSVSQALANRAATGAQIGYAAIGRALSVENKPLLFTFPREEGSNMLIQGQNTLLQAERVLWNSLITLIGSYRKMGLNARFMALRSFPEEIDPLANDMAQRRNTLLRELSRIDDVEIIGEEECMDCIVEVANELRSRVANMPEDLTSKRKFMSNTEPIYLVIPNAELLRSSLNRQKPRRRNAEQSQPISLLRNIPSTKGSSFGGEFMQKSAGTSDTSSAKNGSFGGEFMSNSTGNSNAPFAKIDTGSGYTNQTAITADGTYADDLNYILTNGPEHKVFVIVQVSTVDKLFPKDTHVSSRTIETLFNRMIILRMSGNALSLLPSSLHSKVVENISDNSRSLRALLYSTNSDLATFVPFDLPEVFSGQKDSKIFKELTKN